jgi:hypothetical protein
MDDTPVNSTPVHEQTPEGYEICGQYVKLSSRTHEPWLALAIFQTLHNLGKECGYSDVDEITITIEIMCSGYNNSV